MRIDDVCSEDPLYNALLFDALMLGEAPNITGQVIGGYYTSSEYTGAFSYISSYTSKTRGASWGESTSAKVSFTASSSNAKYDGNDLQPRSIHAMATIKT